MESGSPTSPLAALLRAQRDDLIQRWTRRVLDDPSVPQARRLNRPRLLDHIPELLKCLIDALDTELSTLRTAEAGGRTTGAAEPARKHARLRLDDGYTLAEALRELSHFRTALLDICAHAGLALDPAESILVHATVDESMRTGAVEMERLARAELEDREVRLRLALDSAGLGTWDYNPGTGELRWDARCKELFGLPPEAAVTYDMFHAGVHPDDRARVDEAVARALDPASGGDYHIEYRTVGVMDRIERWVEARGRAWFDERGLPNRLIGMVLDITERKRAEAARQEEVAYRDHFVAILSHDLRNPIGAIAFSAARLLQGEELESTRGRALRRISAAAGRIAHLIDELLDLTRTRLGGGLPVHPAPTDLWAVCRDVLDELEGRHAASTIELDVRGDSQGVWDRQRLAQLVSNLVGNALDYSAPGEPVRVTVRGEADPVILDIHNRGPVIPAGDIPTLFEPFRRGTQRGREHGGRGLGLGLYIAGQIAEAHGGSIHVASSAEKGTNFTVRLPRGRLDP